MIRSDRVRRIQIKSGVDWSETRVDFLRLRIIIKKIGPIPNEPEQLRKKDRDLDLMVQTQWRKKKFAWDNFFDEVLKSRNLYLILFAFTRMILNDPKNYIGAGCSRILSRS